MNFAEMTKLYKAKASRYSLSEARAAIRDIDATLALYRDRAIDDAYVRKLWAERDAMIERTHAICRAKTSRTA